jgi:phage host-nuclease inhibitor protein Gam
MASKRLKIRTLANEAEFISTINSVAALQAAASKVIAKRDAEIVRIQQRYDETLTPIDNQIAALVALADDYANAHRAELLKGDKKSVDTACATYGWRTGNRTVKALGKKYTEEVIIDLLKEKDLEEYVRSVEVIAKDKILIDCTDNKTLTTPEYVEQASGEVAIPAETIALADVGLKITQSESFYIEPKATSGETLKASEAVAS